METMENHGMDAEFNFESALEDYLSTDFGDLEEGTIVKGEIVRVDDDNVLVDVNFNRRSDPHRRIPGCRRQSRL